MRKYQALPVQYGGTYHVTRSSARKRQVEAIPAIPLPTEVQ
jgi:hypothetical protein